jgi:hypothetical protein
VRDGALEKLSGGLLYILITRRPPILKRCRPLGRLFPPLEKSMSGAKS